jgi:cell division protein ZapA (FtsZ GTPase activity inhibitor)
MGKFAINISVAGRNYRLKVEDTEEEFVRAAAATINDKISEFSGNYAFKDKQDLLAMAGIIIGTEFAKLKSTTENNAVVAIDKLHEIDKILSE